MTKAYKRLLWIRHEVKPFEQRSAITPKACATLIKLGHQVVVESSSTRIFEDIEFKAVGCELVASGSWKTAPTEAFILGLKELPVANHLLNHRHIYFAHAYKGQAGSRELLKRFTEGGGKIYDLEYLVNKNQKRVAAFGHWAGYVGVAIALKLWAYKKLNLNFEQLTPLMPSASSKDMSDEMANYLALANEKPKVLILGHKGRSGQGAAALCRELGIEYEGRGRTETANGPHKNILDFDILVNTVLIQEKTAPFLTKELLKENKKLSVISDVSCDPTGPFNPLPLYSECTTMSAPVCKITKEIDLIAIDHLPSLLPRESSEDFSSQLLPFLIDLLQAEIEDTAWERSLECFYREVLKYEIVEPKQYNLLSELEGPHTKNTQ